MNIEEAVNYLRKIVEEKIELSRDDFIPFESKGHGEIYAVDGSSVKLFDAYSFAIYARRVGYVHADEEKIMERNVGEVVIDFIFEENGDAVNDERREKEEMLIAENLDGLVLIDGCIKNNKDGVVGISKKSGLKKGNIPLLLLIKRFGDEIMEGKRWYYEIERGTYAVKFHPYARFAFRVDYYGNDVEEILAEIAAFCNDVSCLGYPYPLAEIHKIVKIDGDEAQYLRYSLIKMAREKEISIDDIENLFYDYHEHLEG